MTISRFHEDLSDEQILGDYLDGIYSKIFNPRLFNIIRISNNRDQNAGIDLTIRHIKSSRIFYVDEKAQLDYINQDLPTFTFETSYLKEGKIKQGWLFDESKKTNYYFLITAIRCREKNISSGIQSVKIHSINRFKLKKLLKEKGLTKEVIKRYDSEIRNSKLSGTIKIKELQHIKEGRFYYSKNNKIERPINLVIRLSYLVQMGVGKVIYEP